VVSLRLVVERRDGERERRWSGGVTRG
jgi:hypothetical protein